MSDLMSRRSATKMNSPQSDDQVTAFAWATGQIEITKGRVPSGAIWIVRGKRSTVIDELAVSARHAYGNKRAFLVPGVPEADGDDEGVDALIKWIGWRARNAKPGLTWNHRDAADAGRSPELR